jgi:hypothetical protein
MGFLDTYKIKKALAVLIASQNPAALRFQCRPSQDSGDWATRASQVCGSRLVAKNPEVIEGCGPTFWMDNRAPTHSF